LSEEDRKAEPFFKPLPYRTPVESLRHASISRMQASPHRQWSPQLRAVLTGAAAVSVLFVIGIVLGELYPGTPQAKPANHSSNGVTVQGSGVSVQTGGATVKTGPPAQPAIQPQVQKNSAGATMTSQTAEQNKPSPRVNQAKKIAAQQGESTIGDDVVIRHYSRPMPTEKPKQSGQQAGLKHFSDLEN
ncbi:MAG TPA: hypothetical protein VE133_14940, partial [Candidatus Sulfotelmatobacter sp.]|nr:hypothetical protein [Candidatus Sulfotelmatobacter sp.]